VDHAGFDAELELAKARSGRPRASSATRRRSARCTTRSRSAGRPARRQLRRLRARSRAPSRRFALVLGRPARSASAERRRRGRVHHRGTPFYGESGGQVGDTRSGPRGRRELRGHATPRSPSKGCSCTAAWSKQGTLETGSSIELVVDHPRRAPFGATTARPTSCTGRSAPWWAPRRLQKGSLVGPEGLRFDYAGSRPLTAERAPPHRGSASTARSCVNAPIETEVLPMDQAKKTGAIGLFEEKYGEVVRMLRMTETRSSSAAAPTRSAPATSASSRS
jgi:alanyl-tRNA synthetase